LQNIGFQAAFAADLILMNGYSEGDFGGRLRAEARSAVVPFGTRRRKEVFHAGP
jgi:hypothetical protein